MKNKNKTVWSNRFKGKTSQSFEKIGSSIHIDKRLYEQDIAASIVHTQMLSKQKIIKNEDANKICLLYTSPSPRDATLSRMPSSA